MRRAGLAVVTLALAAVLVGATMPEAIPEVIDARGFRVIDENGRMRAKVEGDSFVSYDENGWLPRAGMNANGTVYWGENSMTASMGASGFRYHAEVMTLMGADGFAYADENLEVRAEVGADGYRYSDANGKLRAQVGSAELLTTATGAETRYPAAVVLYKPDGKVLWQAPQ